MLVAVIGITASSDVGREYPDVDDGLSSTALYRRLSSVIETRVTHC